jgi:tetratricopeptide (TPR) repeat protein
MSPRALFLILAVLLASTAPARADSFESWAARAVRAYKEKDLPAANEAYTQALKAWVPRNGKKAKSAAYCGRAQVRHERGDDAGAIRDYTSCVALHRDARAYHRRGLLLLKAGRVETAISDFYRAVALDIRFGAAYYDRARAYEMQGDRQFAREDFRHACQLGVKEACAKERALRREKARRTAKRVRPAPKARAAPVEAPEEAPPAADAAPTGPRPVESAPPRPRRRRAAPSGRRAFERCRAALNRCVSRGAAYGTCVSRAPACEVKGVAGCCPGACLQSFQSAINGGSSEASAFRTAFSADSECANPPRSSDED